LKIIKKLEGFIWLFPILIVALFFKLRDLKYFSMDNVLSCYDCFWFVRLSEDFLNSKFSNIDYLSNVPDYAIVPKFLIIIFPVVISKLTGIELNKIFLYAPPVMGTLFVIPMFYWIRHFAPIHVFVGASFLALFNYVYYYRTSLGRYDTDFLILFFVFLILFLLSKSVFNKEKSYLYIILAGIFSQIFMWWYYKPILLIFLSFGLLLGLIVQKEDLKDILKKVIFYMLLCNPVYIYEGLGSFGRYFFGYFLKKAEVLPVSITSSIIELQPVSFDRFLYMTVDNIGVLILGVVGLILLFVFKFRYMVVALPIIAIGLTVFSAGERFLMYLAPFLGMGVGYVLYLMNDFLKKVITSGYLYRFITVVLILMTAFFTTNSNAFVYEVKPSIKDNFVHILNELNSKIREDAYIWQWWDYGNIVEYYLRKGTYVDNHSFNPFKLYAIAYSLMEHDEKKARNLIAFTTNKLSNEYMKEDMTKKDLLNLKDKAVDYNQNLGRNVYVFVYPADIRKDIIIKLGVFGSKHYLGDLSLRRGFYKCIKGEQFYNCGRFEFHRFLTIFNWKSDVYLKNNPYFDVYYTELDSRGQKIRQRLFRNEDSSKRLILEFIRYKDNMYVYIHDKKLSNSIFSRMILGDTTFDCFDLFYNGFPLIMVYSVNPDKNCQ